MLTEEVAVSFSETELYVLVRAGWPPDRTRPYVPRHQVDDDEMPEIRSRGITMRMGHIDPRRSKR